MVPQRYCPASAQWGTLRAISERVETHPLLRLSLATLTIGSLLTVAIINLVGPGRVKTPVPTSWWSEPDLALGASRPETPRILLPKCHRWGDPLQGPEAGPGRFGGR